MCWANRPTYLTGHCPPALLADLQKAGTGGVVERVQEAAASATQTAKEYVQASLGS